jgi:Icc protein
MANLPFKIIQLSDAHLMAEQDGALLGVKTEESFKAVLELIRQEEHHVDLILLSGDLSQDGSEASYLRLANLLQPFHAPVYYVPGNHDDLKVLAHIYPYANVSSHKHIILKNWQLILLNSQKPGAVEGLLAPSQLSYLQHCLQTYPEHHAIISFHHNPLSVGCEWLDKQGVKNANEFWQLVNMHTNVHTVLFGHVHQEFFQQTQQISCYAAPSTCIQFKRQQNNFGLENLPPGYRWINIYADGRLETGIKRTANYIGVFEAHAKGY